MTDSDMDVWFSRDLPLLQYTVPLVDSDPIGGGINLIQAVGALGWDEGKVAASGRALEDAGYLEIQWMSGAIGRVVRVSPEARRIVGLWPTAETLADRIEQILEAMLEADISDAERSKWQAIRDGAMYAGRGVLVQLAAQSMGVYLPH